MAQTDFGAYLTFTGSDDGVTLTPVSSFTNVTVNISVFDDPADGDLDSVDYFVSPLVPYSGFTIQINGNDYGIFKDTTSSAYFIPYDAATDNLALLHGTNLTQPVTLSGDNATVVNCFVTGTAIATPDGPRPIETLKEGDLVLTADGRTCPVLWVAWQRIAAPALNRGLPADRLPVRIAAGALGNDLPKADLCVSADHALAIGGLLVNAGALVNGTTIRPLRRDEVDGPLVYWHLELEQHALVLANGVESESFVDYRARKSFDSFDRYIARHGAERIIREMDLPRVSARRQLPAWLARRLHLDCQDRLSA